MFLRAFPFHWVSNRLRDLDNRCIFISSSSFLLAAQRLGSYIFSFFSFHFSVSFFIILFLYIYTSWVYSYFLSLFSSLFLLLFLTFVEISFSVVIDGSSLLIILGFLEVYTFLNLSGNSSCNGTLLLAYNSIVSGVFIFLCL